MAGAPEAAVTQGCVSFLSVESTEPRTRSSSSGFSRASPRHPPRTPSTGVWDPQSSPRPASPGPHPLPTHLPSAPLTEPPAHPPPLRGTVTPSEGSTTPFPQRSHLSAWYLPDSPTRIRGVSLPGHGTSARPDPAAPPRSPHAVPRAESYVWL